MQQRTVRACQKSLHRRDPFDGHAQRTQLARIGVAVNNTGQNAFEIIHIPQRFPHFVPQHGFLHQFLDSVQSAEDGDRLNERLFDPAAHQTLAHRGAGAVKNTEE